MELAISLILISVLSFARAQVDCPPFNVSELGATDMLTRGGLIGAALAAGSGDPSMLNVQVHDSNIVCLRSGRTRDTYRGVSVVVNYTCTGSSRSECTGNPILSQFEFECVTGPTWTASVGGSASNIITTPPDGTLSTTLRTDCGVCVSPARSGFASITNNEQHCGSCNSNCNTTQPSLMRCFDRTGSGCCNFFENNMCVGSCTSPLVPNSNFDCASPTTMLTSTITTTMRVILPTSTMLISSPTSSIPTSTTPTSSTSTSTTPTSSTSTSTTPTSSTSTSTTPTSSMPTSMPPNRFDGGKTAGIVIGLVLFLILVIIIVAVVGYCVMRRKSRYTKV